MAKLERSVVEGWVRSTTGIFGYSDLFAEVDVADIENKDYARQLMRRFCEEKIIVPVNGRHGLFRLVDSEAPVINWKDAKDYKGLDNLRWPFGLERYVKIHPRNLVVVGGDPNAGKSAFLYEFISLNYKKYNIVLFDSENSRQELAIRFSKFEGSDNWPDDFVRERNKNFADVIEPAKINIIDYLEIHDNFYAVGKLLRDIRDALKSGIAVVAIQKAKGAELPLGRDFSQQLARLVVTIDPGVLTIRKAKFFANRDVNPNGAKFSFKLLDGAKFIDVKRVD